MSETSIVNIIRSKTNKCLISIAQIVTNGIIIESMNEFFLNQLPRVWIEHLGNLTLRLFAEYTTTMKYALKQSNDIDYWLVFRRNFLLRLKSYI